ncbi:MAG: hypothetical protein WDA22_12845 [Bacteroidota bacterium]
MVIDISAVKEVVHQNVKKIKSIQCVSERLHVSYETLRKSFLKKEHIPLANYITIQKVQGMKQHLLEEDDPCFFVCYEYGYREDSGAKIFKKLTGMTMLEFRQRNKTK